MQDKVPYDIYVNDPAPFRMSEKPHTEARPSIDCLDDIKVGQQVIIICGARVKPHDPWTGTVYRKYKSKSLAIYQKDRKDWPDNERRKFQAEWRTVTSDCYIMGVKKLRNNQQLVIQRIS
jgi:hypothetical protein